VDECQAHSQEIKTAEQCVRFDVWRSESIEITQEIGVKSVKSDGKLT
jgi:hypothetical protein